MEIGDSLEALLACHSTSCGTVYQAMLLLVAVAIVALFSVSVDLTIRGTAMLRPLSERQSLRIASAGVVARLAVARDAHVRAGDTILVLGTNVAEAAHAAVRRARSEQEEAATDLR